MKICVCRSADESEKEYQREKRGRKRLRFLAPSGMENRGQLWDKAPVFCGHREERRALRLIFMSFDSGIYLEQRVRGGFLPFYAESAERKKLDGGAERNRRGAYRETKRNDAKKTICKEIFIKGIDKIRFFMLS